MAATLIAAAVTSVGQKEDVTMRRLAPAFLALAVALAIVSMLLWRELQSEQRALQSERQSLQEEQQLAGQLRAQLAEARAQRAPSPALQSATEAMPPPAKKVEVPVLDALITDAVKKQKALQDNSDYHEARVAEMRTALKSRNPLLARELGISEREADAILDILAEDQLQQEGQTLDLLTANGSRPDAAAIEQMKRLQKAQQQQRNSTLMSMLGPTRFEQLQYIEETQSARTKMVNMNTLLGQSGRPLTTDQALSFTKVMADEQKREEKESQELRKSGRATQVSQVDRAVEGDRRILDAAASFLSAQQLETIRTRFEQRQAMERASGVVQTRERTPAQD